MADLLEAEELYFIVNDTCEDNELRAIVALRGLIYWILGYAW